MKELQISNLRKKLGHPAAIVIFVILVVAFVYVCADFLFWGSYRSVTLLVGKDLQILGPVNLPAMVAGLFVHLTVLAIAIASIAPVMKSLQMPIREKLAEFGLYSVFLLILAQMVVAFIAWWPRIGAVSPSVPARYVVARVIDLVVEMLIVPLFTIMLFVVITQAEEYGKRLFGRPENPVS